jgi:mannose-6-phosphate isomerase-like protein (cupin superfamily)
MADEIVNPRTGQRIRFLERSPELLRIETTNPPTGVPEPTHVHPHQVTSATLVSGSLRFVVNGEDRWVGPGESITIAAGTPHHFVNDGDTDAVAIQEARPALCTAEFFETYFGLAARAQLDEHGKPPLLGYAILGPAFANEIRLTSPPWPIQRALFALLWPLARLRGYGARWMSSTQ